MNENKTKKGFTLIELLVVIAIIGILSSIVLVSLNSARNKGADAAIGANLANMRAQAEIIYDGAGSYAGLCANTIVVNALNSTARAAGATVATGLDTVGTATTVVCHESPTAWAIGSPLKTSSVNSWCVDSNGASKQITAGYLGASAVVCP